MREFKSFSDFRCNMHLVPQVVALDVITRINDWLQAGGNLDDKYIKGQLEFDSKFIEYKGE